MAEPRYTISILTYTAIPEMQRCLTSVHNFSRDYKLILTANGSPAAFRYFNLMAERFPPGIVTVVNNEQNEGFIKPNNHALTLCDTPYFVLLNDDCEVSDGWLQKLEAPFLIYPNAALSGPRSGCHSLHDNLDGFMGPRFEYLEGSCLMGKTEILKRHGLFSDYLQFAYGEDSDLSLRMRRLGYTLHQVDLRYRHRRSVTSRRMHLRPVQLKNQAEVIKRFSHYLKVRRMDYPIIVRRTEAIGDVLLTTPIVKALKTENPINPIYIETKVPIIYRGNPYVTAVSKLMGRVPHALMINLDMAYENRPNTNICDAYAEVAKVLPKQRWSLQLDLLPQEREYAKTKLPDGNGSWCAVHVGPSWPSKTWPMERYGTVFRFLFETGHNIVLVGHPSSLRPDDELDLIDLRGATTLHQLAAVIERCDLFLGIDSFPLHAAHAVGTPAIGLFGVTLPEMVLANMDKVFPVVADRSSRFTGRRHMVSGKTFIDCPPGLNPMNTITPEMVIGAIRQALQERNLCQPIPKLRSIVT